MRLLSAKARQHCIADSYWTGYRREICGFMGRYCRRLGLRRNKQRHNQSPLEAQWQMVACASCSLNSLCGKPNSSHKITPRSPPSWLAIGLRRGRCGFILSCLVTWEAGTVGIRKAYVVVRLNRYVIRYLLSCECLLSRQFAR